MRRHTLGLALLASFVGVSALPVPARAAEVTRVLSTEPDDPFALTLQVRWERSEERASITREEADPASGRSVDAPAVRYGRLRNEVVTRLAAALYRDVELHAELPYVLADDVSWRYALDENGFSVGPPGNTSSLLTDNLDAMGRPCAGPCPLFPAPGAVYRGGQPGDLKAGLAWAIFNGARDDTKPTWVVGFDATFPTAKRYDPAAGRDPASWESPFRADSRRGPVGEQIWKWDVHTAFSRRLGAAEPYFRAHVTGMTPSTRTFSNCDHAGEFPAQFTQVAARNCDRGSWKGDSGAKLPWVGGLAFGVELLPFEDRREEQRITIDLRVSSDYTSSQRFFNELTDLSGRIHQTGAYLALGARAALEFQASRFISLGAAASLSTRTAHDLSGEAPGKRRGGFPAGDVSGVCDAGQPVSSTNCNPDLNPNFDWRYDTPGRRFRIEDVLDFALQAHVGLSF